MWPGTAPVGHREPLTGYVIWLRILCVRSVVENHREVSSIAWAVSSICIGNVVYTAAPREFNVRTILSRDVHTRPRAAFLQRSACPHHTFLNSVYPVFLASSYFHSPRLKSFQLRISILRYGRNRPPLSCNILHAQPLPRKPTAMKLALAGLVRASFSIKHGEWTLGRMITVK
jgi:hypothetical protein